MKRRPVDEQARAINQILRGHFNYYGLAGNARKLQSFWNFAQMETYAVEAQPEGSLGGPESLLDQHPLARPRIRISYPQLAAYSRLLFRSSAEMQVVYDFRRTSVKNQFVLNCNLEAWP